MTPACPRCDSRDLVPSTELLEASDERFRATHECKQCQARFRVVPPDAPFNPPHVRGAE